MSSDTDAISRLANFRNPTPEEVQRDIDRTMREVSRRDARNNPNALHGYGGSVTPAGAVPTVGLPNVPGETNGVPNNWGLQAEVPFGPVGGAAGQAAIERLTPTYDTPEAAISRLTLTQLNEMLGELKKREQTPAVASLMSTIEAAQLKLGGG